MSLIKANAAQLGQSGTATQNFTLDATAADGTMKLARGNAGATTQDILMVDAAGQVSSTVTPAQFDNGKKLATTEFVQRALGSVSRNASVALPGTLDASHAGARAVLSGTGGLTLPLLSGFPEGTIFRIYNNSPSAVVATRSGSDLITSFTLQSVTTFSIPSGETVEFLVGNGQWVVEGGTAALKNAISFMSSLNASGYQKLPSGLIIQWGSTGSISSGGNLAVTLPIAFPTANLNAIVTPNGGGNISASISGTVATTSASSITIYHFSGGGGAANYRYLAIGY